VLCMVLTAASISLYSINLSIFITETGCVYCAVRTRSLNTIKVNFNLQSVKYSVIVSVYSTLRGPELYNVLVFLSIIQSTELNFKHKSKSTYTRLVRRSKSVFARVCQK
jgi:hypothetical protein